MIFLCLDAGADRDVARVVAGLTPAKSGAKRPQSVVEVVDALDGACATAPTFTALVCVARGALRAARMRCGNVAPSAPSPIGRHATKRRKNRGGTAGAAFSPHLEVAAGGVREQLLELFTQLVEKTIAHLVATIGAPAERAAFLDEDWRCASLCPPTIPHQPDAVSCGVCMLVAIWCCMSGASLHACLGRPDCPSINYWHDVITLCLYRGSFERRTVR